MGWMWSSKSPPPPPSSDNKGSEDQSQPKQQPPPPSENSKPSSPEAEAAADPEIAKFLAQVQSEFSSSGRKPSSRNNDAANKQPPEEETWSFWESTFSSSTTTTTTTTTTNPQQQQQQQQQQQPDNSNDLLDPISESLLPTTMSCRDAWDRAFHCNSLGGQWTSVYREGNVRSCSEHWDDFWFCMRTRSYTSRDMKAEAIREHFRRKERLRYHQPNQLSSTDVWEARTEKLPPGNGAFQQPFSMPAIDDEEWRIMEIERRRAVQEGLRREEEKRQARRPPSSGTGA